MENVVTVVERINHHLAPCSRCKLVSRSTVAQRRLPFRDLKAGGRNRCDPPQPRCWACTNDMEAGPLSPNSVQLVNLNRSIVGLGKDIFAIFAAKT